MSELSYAKYINNNYEAILKSDKVVCICCKVEFTRENYPEWKWESHEIPEPYGNPVPETDTLCPACDVDALVGDATYKWTKEEVDNWHEEGFKTKIKIT